MDNIKNKKYDLIVGNPPYDRSLHLKIIEAAMQHLTDDGKACYIHPARWLQDPLWEMKRNRDHKKYNNSILSYLQSFEILKAKDVSELFSIFITTDVMISYINKNLKSPIDIMSKIYSNDKINIINKIIRYGKENNINSHIEKDKIDGIRIKCPLVGTPCSANRKDKASMTAKTDEPLINGYCISNNKFFSENTSQMKGKKILAKSIKFDTVIEAENYLKCIRTNFFRHILILFMTDINIPWIILPWMKDYTNEWTDKRLCEFFELTKEQSNYMSSEIL